MIELKDKKIIRVIQKDSSLMHLTWMINNICNNKCTYCLPELNSGKGHHYKWENAKKFLELLFEKYPKIHCSVTGGEPSISHFFPELVKFFNSNGHTIGTTSNAFKPIEYWEDISKYLKYVCFSYHPEFPAKDFKEKVIAASLNTFVTVRLMMLPSKWDHCIEVFNSLKDIDTCFLEPVRIMDWGSKHKETHVYTKDQLDWFHSDEAAKPHQKILKHLGKQEILKITSDFQFEDGSILVDDPNNNINSIEFINCGMTNFEGYVCEVGLKSLFVNSSGLIYLANCGVGGPIGKIDEFEQIKWPTMPVICNKKYCHCTIDVNVNKWVRNYNQLKNQGLITPKILNPNT
jgi:organic radical activating enzyme